MTGSDELLRLLHRKIKESAELDRAEAQLRWKSKDRDQDEEPDDADEQHPLYGRYLAEFLDDNEVEPGHALVGLFRATLGDLKSAISKKRRPRSQR